MFNLSETQQTRAIVAAKHALEFCVSSNALLPAAIIRQIWLEGDPAETVTALANYQNVDGGFGNRLEPDIHHPSSNPFAARIAMQYLTALPEDQTVDMRHQLQTWLVENQHEDGDWHFSNETRSGFLQPWFAAWQHPGLNPACCLAGLAASIGIATEHMLARTAALFDAKAELDEVQNGEFYTLLPYVEYTAGVTPPNSQDWYEAVSARIVSMVESDALEDAEHFFTLALGGSTEITRRIPIKMISLQVDSLLDEQLTDGGWPTPYDQAWRVWTTAGNMMTLARLGEARR